MMMMTTMMMTTMMAMVMMLMMTTGVALLTELWRDIFGFSIPLGKDKTPSALSTPSGKSKTPSAHSTRNKHVINTVIGAK